MKNNLTLCVFRVLCFLPLMAQAVTYYVSPNGNNANSGLSLQTAFKTLQYAADKVKAGDSVVVAPGTYSGFYLDKSGSAADPIVFYAQAGVLINAKNNTTDDGINLEAASHIIIEGFKVKGVPRAGIRSVLNHHVTIRKNHCDSNGKWGVLTGFSDDILIEHNITSRSKIEHGIYFSNSADRPVIRNNTCWGNNANGIHMNGDVSLGGDGIISNARVENNIIYENGKAGGSGINCDGVQASIIQNNLLYSNHASGISLYKIDGGDGSKNNTVVNNTIIQASDGRWALNIMNGSSGNKVYNNILYHPGSFRGSISLDAASLTGFVSDNNVVTDRFSVDEGNTSISFNQWKTNTAQDKNSFISSPAVLFVNPSAHDYHLVAGSPAIDKGTALSAPLHDLEGALRPQGAAHDIGAYEYGSVAGISPTLSSLTFFNAMDEDSEILFYDLGGKRLAAVSKHEVAGQLRGLPGRLLLYTVLSPRGQVIGRGKLFIRQ